MSLKNYPNFLQNLSEDEMDAVSGHVYQFNSFRLDLAERKLSKSDVRLPLTPKAFEVLALLVSQSGHVVDKEEILSRIWADSYVEEANLTRVIHTLRRVLGENDKEKFIETVSKKGYRFIVPVEIHEGDSQTELTNGRAYSAHSDPPVLAVFNKVDKLPVRRRSVLLVAGSLCAIFLVLLLLNFQPWAGKSASARRFTTNEEANRLYLLGAALSNKAGRKNAEKAIEYFTQALELDPNYAPAYAGIASSHTSMAITAGGDTHEQYIKAKTAIEKALAIDNDLAETHSAMGDLKWICEWDFAGAEAAHKRALQLDPNIPQAHRKYAMYLLSMGRFDEAVSRIKNAIELEPGLPANHRAYAQIMLYARRNDDAIVRAKQTLEMDSEFVVSHHFLIAAYRAKGDDAQAFDWFLGLEKANGSEPDKIKTWQDTYAASGWRGIQERQFADAQEAEKKGEPNYMHLANLATELGLLDQAFAYLEKTYAKRQWAMVMLNANPRYDPLRSDPRFDELVRRVGLK